MQIENEKERLGKLLTGIQAVVSGDFTQTIHLDKHHDDDLLPLETGFNILVTDLNHLLEQNEIKIKELEKALAERDDAQLKLVHKIEDLEKLFKFATDREVKMSELKNELAELNNLATKYKD